MKKILIIQTASIGDVVLATSLLETLHASFPEARIDILLRSGFESLFHQHPFISRVLVWDKKKEKYKNLLRLLFGIRQVKYDLVVNVQRFASTGFLTGFSGAKERRGFSKNPFSIFFSKRFKHTISRTGTAHEIDRNFRLIADLVSGDVKRPKLYPSAADDAFVSRYKLGRYITFSPASLWFTKQFPLHKISEFIVQCDADMHVYLLGSAADVPLCEKIMWESGNPQVMNLAGRLSLLQSAALMEHAQMNFVNDSAPQHLASSRNAPVTALFCSTVPEFGFGPLSDDSVVVQIDGDLECRPCGLHGHQACPKGHFKCGEDIDLKQLNARV